MLITTLSILSLYNKWSYTLGFLNYEYIEYSISLTMIHVRIILQYFFNFSYEKLNVIICF